MSGRKSWSMVEVDGTGPARGGEVRELLKSGILDARFDESVELEKSHCNC